MRYRNIRLFLSLIILILLVNNTLVGEGGTDISKYKGFVFIDGVYLDAPYEVKIEGLTVTINGKVVYKTVKPLPLPERDTLPELPKGINENSTIEDYSRTGHESIMFWYFHRHFPKEKAYEKIREFYESLPFIEKVELRKPNVPEILVITTRTGHTLNLDIGNYGLFPPKTEQEALRQVTEKLEKKKEYFTKQLLEKGDCIIFFSNRGELRLPHQKALHYLKPMVEVLDSERSFDEKVDYLQRMSILPIGDTKLFNPLISNFKSSDQLYRRIEYLEKHSGVRPRKLSELPKIPPAQAEREARERYLKNLEKYISPSNVEKIINYRTHQIRKLLEIVRIYSRKKNDKFCRAIQLLGKLRATDEEVILKLSRYLSYVPDDIKEKKKKISEKDHVAAVALVEIGYPSVRIMMKRIAEAESDEKIELAAWVIMKIEGKQQALNRIQDAVEKHAESKRNFQKAYNYIKEY